MQSSALRPGSTAGGGIDNTSVIRATGDPTDEVRSTLARLTARARQLAGNEDDLRVVRNGRSLYEVSKKATEEARQLWKKSPYVSGGDGTGTASQASVELFMAKQLGLDVQEQQRLLHQLEVSHVQQQLATDGAATEQMGLRAGPGMYYYGGAESGAAGVAGGPYADDVDGVVARVKSDLLLQAQNAVHQREKERLQDLEYALFKAAWTPFYVGMADDLESLAMRRGGDGVLPAPSSSSSQAGLGPRDDPRSAVGLVSLLSGGSVLAQSLLQKAVAFAGIVEDTAPTQWTAGFSAYVTDQAVRTGDELAVLWTTVERVLEPVQREGSAATVMSYVASSRTVMEYKYLTRLLTSVMRTDPARVDELVNLTAERVMDVVARATGSNDGWAHVFTAMRAGRYDVAVLAAQKLGVSAVEGALQRCGKASPVNFHALTPATDLQSLYAEAATRDDPYRLAVLFILLAGRTGESDEVAQRVQMELCNKVAASLEDALWLRLACVRGVEESAKVTRLQSLTQVQRILLDDLPDLVTLARGNVPRLTSLLLHALLPSTGLRLLLENDVAYIDGVHLALCFNSCDLLQCSPLESPVDLARHLVRYCSLVLLDLDHRSRDQAYAAGAIFDYFHKTGFDEAFVEMCQKDLLCTRLFGPRGTIGSGDAVLLNGPKPPSADLLKAMNAVAELAATRNNAAMATHVLLVLAYAAHVVSKENVASNAINRSMHVFCPALAQAFYLPSSSSLVADLAAQAVQLRQILRSYPDSDDRLSRTGIATFDVLCTMAELYINEANAAYEEAVGCFFVLPFVPRSAATDLERCVQAYLAANTYVIAAAGAIVPVALRAAANLLRQYSCSPTPNGLGTVTDAEKSIRLRQYMQVVCEWYRRCCSQPGPTYREVPAALGEFERQYLQ